MLMRFIAYANKVFDFSRSLSSITDTRLRPRIPTAAVLMSSFLMHLTRLGSLNAFDSERRVPKKLEPFIGLHKPGADTIARVHKHINTDDLRCMHRNICTRLKRNKVLDSSLPVQAIGIDGHEFFSHQKTSVARVLRTTA